MAAMISQNNVQSVTVTIMEVPCCTGLAMMAKEAVKQSGLDIPVETVVIGINGEIRS